LANLSAMLILSIWDSPGSSLHCPDSLPTEMVAEKVPMGSRIWRFRNGRSQAFRLPVEYRFEGP